MTDIGEVTVKELTEYADYCMGKIPVGGAFWVSRRNVRNNRRGKA